MTLPQRFGAYGGRYVPETLVSALEQLEQTYETYRADGTSTMPLMRM